MSRRKAKMAADGGDLQRIFDTFDNDDDGIISTAELGVAIRASGKNPSEAEMKKMIEEIGGEGAKIDFNKFKELQKRKMPMAADQEADIRHAFHALDRDGNGYILEAELRQLLMNLGEGLQSNEVDMLLKYVEVNSAGEIHYDKFISELING
eukprot:CAMPEP_0177650320 /NCGR_PEP_ID=MMETSP0447-20121125/11878_1 /TAXON_ID=0 /ORGANISM="Stygamoeba regulata, Strain BSH-02190019" /LENGTH=151 /DNA_ID=CAMNT_0019153179 /DNA_START=90 /DNA_END=545 /DNA_ORIENTATION=-